MKKYGKRIAAAIPVYLCLCAFLMLSEQHAGGSIRTFWDAMWYSLVTLTTVGYGDLYPVSVCGKLIGVVFVVLSLGFLAFVVGSAIRLFEGQWLPKMRLRKNRKRQWWIFSERNEASEALAQDLLSRHPDSCAVFCGEKGNGAEKQISTLRTPKELLRDKSLPGGRRSVFLISSDESRNRVEASALLSFDADIYCRGEETDASGSVVFFSATEACARDYWNRFPVNRQEEKIVLLGCGEYAQALLNQAVPVNCMTPFHTMAYYMEGDWKSYLRYHYGIEQCFSMNEQVSGRDALFFEEQAIAPEILLRADRVILCGDDFQENAKQAAKFAKWFAFKGQLYVLTDDLSVPGIHFGAASMVFTEAMVMRQEQDMIARSMHENYRKNHGGAPWEELPAFIKASNRAVADHISIKKQLMPGSTQEQRRQNEHDRWTRFHALYNWTYAPERDNANRQHPSMTAYEKLSEAEKAKDDYAWNCAEE